FPVPSDCQRGLNPIAALPAQPASGQEDLRGRRLELEWANEKPARSGGRRSSWAAHLPPPPVSAADGLWVALSGYRSTLGLVRKSPQHSDKRAVPHPQHQPPTGTRKE